MKKMFKQIISTILLVSMLALSSACTPNSTPAQTPATTPMQEVQTEVYISDLNNYTIVYPDTYQAWQLDEVYLLQSVIQHITNTDIPVISDSTGTTGKEIIMGSSKRRTSVSEQISAFSHDIDYTIAVDNGNIILGGKSYYADMKAVYDFVNNYLGYNDLKDEYKEPAFSISEAKTILYVEPVFTIMADNPGKYPFKSANDVKTMADAGFNMVKLDAMKLESEDMQNCTKWCVRYNIRMILRPVYNLKTRELNISNSDIVHSNPLMFGHYVKYEIQRECPDEYDEICNMYKEKYSQYGWKLVLNFNIQADSWETCKKMFPNNEYYKNADIFSCTYNLQYANNTDSHLLEVINSFRNEADLRGIPTWFCINTETLTSMSININTRPSVYIWRSYMALSIGASGVEYAYYRRNHVVNDDFTPGRDYSLIQKANKELTNLAEYYSNYEYVNSYVINPKHANNITKFVSTYDLAQSPIAEYKDSFGAEIPFFISVFKAKDNSDKEAVLMVCMEELSEFDSVYPSSCFKFSKENVTYFHEGKLLEPRKDEEGYSRISVSNGKGVFMMLQ